MASTAVLSRPLILVVQSSSSSTQRAFLPWRNKTNCPFRLVFSTASNNHNNQRDDTTKLQKQPPLPNTIHTKPASLPHAYASLAKLRLSGLVVSTTAAGCLAAGPPLNLLVLGSVCTGTLLCSASAAALNQLLEIGRDQKMKRTQQRPLITGVLSSRQGWRAATVWGVSGTACLYLGTDPLTTTLGITNIVLYAGLYTYLKPKTIYNTWVGAVVGAIPPVMGYTAATHTLLDPVSLHLFGLLYLWQLPHFLSLSVMYNKDYSRGGFQMLGSVDPPRAANVMTRYALYLSALPVLSSVLLDVTHIMYLVESVVLNGYFVYTTLQFRHDRTNQNARKVFLTSLWYLPCSLMLFLLHSKAWDATATTNNNTNNRLTEFVATIRHTGKQLCLHEQVTNRHEDDCPVILGERASQKLSDNLEEKQQLLLQQVPPEPLLQSVVVESSSEEAASQRQ